MNGDAWWVIPPFSSWILLQKDILPILVTPPPLRTTLLETIRPPPRRNSPHLRPGNDPSLNQNKTSQQKATRLTFIALVKFSGAVGSELSINPERRRNDVKYYRVSGRRCGKKICTPAPSGISTRGPLKLETVTSRRHPPEAVKRGRGGNSKH